MKTEWTENVTQYFLLWKNTLHQNCKNIGHCECHIGAFGLAESRIQNIRDGMPDLSAEEERDIWEIAFTIHERACKQIKSEFWRAGIITPTWAINAGPPCTCFERARRLYNKKLQSEVKDIQLYSDLNERDI